MRTDVCQHPELIIHLYLLPINLSVADRMSHLYSSSPISSVTLAYVVSSFEVKISFNVSFLVAIVAHRIPIS